MTEKIDWWKRLNKFSYIYVPSKLCFLLTIIVCLIVSLVFFLLLLVSQQEIKSHSVRYDDQGCDFPSTAACSISIEIDEDMEKPVYVYYDLRNFYQNHRIYVKSYNFQQLTGSEATIGCSPIESIEELRDHMEYHFLNLGAFNNDEDANPCGLIAASYFNDVFVITDGNGNNIPLEIDDIAWKSDEDLFENGDRSWTNKENPRFAVWMRTAQNKDFKKLYAKIDQDILKGQTLQVDINVNSDFSPFDGEKYFVLTTTNSLGTNNDVLTWFFFFCFVIAIGELLLMCVLQRTTKEISIATQFDLDR